MFFILLNAEAEREKQQHKGDLQEVFSFYRQLENSIVKTMTSHAYQDHKKGQIEPDKAALGNRNR